MNSDQSELYFRVIATPGFLFGAIASFFLFRGAQWARIAVGITVLLMAVLVLAEAWMKRHWPDEDGFLGLFALVSALILLFPRRCAVA
jgi:peptidoglycan/LPS O-acetylase OafA/YrhL